MFCFSNIPLPTFSCFCTCSCNYGTSVSVEFSTILVSSLLQVTHTNLADHRSYNSTTLQSTTSQQYLYTADSLIHTFIIKETHPNAYKQQCLLHYKSTYSCHLCVPMSCTYPNPRTWNQLQFRLCNHTQHLMSVRFNSNAPPLLSLEM